MRLRDRWQPAARVAAIAGLALVVLLCAAGRAGAADELTPAQKCARDGWPVTGGAQALAARAPQRQAVGGWAFLDGSTPLVGARVRIRAGRRWLPVMRGSAARTGRLGTFLVAVKRLPAGATVVVSGGRALGRPFRGTLFASLRNQAPGATVYVNPASTLVATYEAAFPKRAARAAAAVKRFLGIPGWATLGPDLQTSSTLFSAAKFRAQARGKVDLLLARLAFELGQGKRHAFKGGQSPGAPAPVWGPFAKWFGTQLAAGAVSFIGGKAMGWVFSQFGVDDGISRQIAELSAKLDQINAKLSALGDQVQEIITQSDKQYLVTVAKDLDNVRTDVKSRMSDLLWIADMGQQDPKPDPKYLEQQTCTKLKQLRPLAEGTTGYGYGIEKINGSFFPEGTGSESITQAASLVVRDKYRWWTGASRAEVAALVNYWISVQATWLNLKLEWEHSVAPCPSTPAPTPANCESLRWVATYLSDARAETNTLPPELPRGTWIDRKTGLMWAPNYVYRGFVHPPPADWYDTFTYQSGQYPPPWSTCQNYEITLCAIEGVGRTGEMYGGITNWGPPTEDEISTLIDGWRDGGRSSPAAFLTAPPPNGPGASADWLALGKNLVWTGTCREPGDTYRQCVRYDLGDGSHGFVPTQYEQGPPATAGFLLDRPVDNVGAYWTARLSVGARYVASNGSDADNTCSAYSRPCRTLARAIDQAKADDVIDLGAGRFAGGVTLTKSVTIEGIGAGLTTIAGGGPVIRLGQGTTDQIEDVTITGGRVTADQTGGGIDNDGALTLVDSTVTANTAPDGGGLVNGAHGTVRIESSTFNANTGDRAGGLENRAVTQAGASPTMTVINSTINGNVGGGLVGVANAGVALINVTVTGNAPTAQNSSGAVSGQPAIVTNTIIAQNPRMPDCDGTMIAGPRGHNLIGSVGSGCFWSPGESTGNLIGRASSPIDPKLDPLADNGGPTLTDKLGTGSPAIGAGDATACADPATVDGVDQRGYVRPSGSCDMGAYDSKGLDQPTSG